MYFWAKIYCYGVANKVPFYYYFHQFNLIVSNLSINTLTANEYTIYKSSGLTEIMKMVEPNSMSLHMVFYSCIYSADLVYPCKQIA